MGEEPGTTCRTCGRAILETTARLKGGLCGPCRNKLQAEEAKAKWEPMRRQGLAPVTPDELEKVQSAADIEAACHFIFDKAHWKWTEHGEPALTTGERTVIAVETFFGETCNGGLLQFLLNESGAFARDLPASLMRVGLTAYVPLALELTRLFPAALSRDPDARGDQLDALDGGDDTLAALSERFFELYHHDEGRVFRERLIEYIRANPREFVSDFT